MRPRSQSAKSKMPGYSGFISRARAMMQSTEASCGIESTLAHLLSSLLDAVANHFASLAPTQLTRAVGTRPNATVHHILNNSIVSSTNRSVRSWMSATVHDSFKGSPVLR